MDMNTPSEFAGASPRNSATRDAESLTMRRLKIALQITTGFTVNCKVSSDRQRTRFLPSEADQAFRFAQRWASMPSCASVEIFVCTPHSLVLVPAELWAEFVNLCLSGGGSMDFGDGF